MFSEFQSVLQSYYAPVASLILFAWILGEDQLLSWKEKRIFFLQLVVVGSLLLATWVERCVSLATAGDVFWRIRSVCVALEFTLAPLSPLCLNLLYRTEHRVINYKKLFCLPAAVNGLITMSSLWTGLVTHVSTDNVYTRGPLYPLPYLAAAFYLLGTLRFITRNETPGRQMETKIMVGVILAVATSSACEITMRRYGMLWSTTMACLILLFLVTTTNKVLYDPLTGTYTRLAYHKRLDTIQNGRGAATLVIVDMNGLKAINDTLGHAAGDRAIIQIAQALLAIRMRGLKLYRYGGDEFVLIGDGCIAQWLEKELEQALNRCGAVEGIPLSFAYGIEEYQGGDLHTLLEEMDQKMYRKKQAMKQREPGAQPQLQEGGMGFRESHENPRVRK